MLNNSDPLNFAPILLFLVNAVLTVIVRDIIITRVMFLTMISTGQLMVVIIKIVIIIIVIMFKIVIMIKIVTS